jgi:hypothetical protein
VTLKGVSIEREAVLGWSTDAGGNVGYKYCCGKVECWL